MRITVLRILFLGALLTGVTLVATACGGAVSSFFTPAGGNGDGDVFENVTTLLRWNEYDHDFEWPAREAWLTHADDEVESHFPNHNGTDQCVALGSSGSISGSFSYTWSRDLLAGERVGAWLRAVTGTGSWAFIGDAVTDANGNASWTWPGAQISTAGTYFVRMVVYGDGTHADSTIRVIAPAARQSAVVFDIDQTLSAHNEQQLRDAIGIFFDPYYQPRMQDDANKVAAQLAKAGHQIVYLTERPYWLARETREFLQQKGFPHGLLCTYAGEAPTVVAGVEAESFKTTRLGELDAAGLDFVYAFGNATSDINAYAAAGIPAASTYILGANGGNGGTVALTAWADLYGTLVDAPSEPYRVVLVVIDGLRPDALREYIDNHAPGDSALVRIFGGGVETHESLTTAPAVTYAGHAALVTGRHPVGNGMTGNEFVDRATGTAYSFVGNTWSYDDVLATFQGSGLANGVLNTHTLYEEMNASGRYGVCSGHMYFRGSEYVYPATDQLAKYVSNVRELDADMVTNLINRLDGQDTPDLMTVYLPGLDSDVHEDGNVGGDELSPNDGTNSQIIYLRDVIDAQIARLEAHLQSMGILDDCVWVITSDHGMTDTPSDESYAVNLDPSNIDDELETILEDAGYTDVWDKPADAEGDFNAHAGCNGSLLNISLRNRATDSWGDEPRFLEDVVPVLASIQNHRRVGGQLNHNGSDMVDEVLVRRGFDQPYEAIRASRLKVTWEAIHVINDEDAGDDPGELYFDLLINGQVWQRLGVYNASDDDVLSIGQSFELDMMPGNQITVGAYGEDDDLEGIIFESLGEASLTITSRSQVGQVVLISSQGDFELSLRIELVSLPTYQYEEAPGFGNFCPFDEVANPDYVDGPARIALLNRNDRSGDIIVISKWQDGFYFGETAAANHGSLFGGDGYQTFAIGGTPITAARTFGAASVVDIAPTIARVLGIDMRRIDGDVRLTEDDLPQLPQRPVNAID